MRTLVGLGPGIVLGLLTFGPALGAADLPPLGDQVSAWATSIGHGAVATAEKREGRWTFALAGQPFAAGHAEVAAQDVLFEIGSITKVFTGILLADAVADGKLSLDDTLAQRLPAKFEYAATGAVTLKQLATHSSCLPRIPENMMNAGGDDPYAQYDRKALFEYLASAKLPAQPPCRPDYSNLGFGILGVVLEIAYDKPWAALVAEKITGPLGMANTVQELSAAQQARFAEPWSDDQRVHPWAFMALAGAGALRSSLADMSKLADALLAGPKGPLAKAWPLLAGDFMDMPVEGGQIGLALIHTKSGGEESYLHDGATGGYRSLIQVHPTSGHAAVVLASNATANPDLWLADREAKERPPVIRSVVALPTATLEQYAGVYTLDKTMRFTLIQRGDGLVARVTGALFLPVFASARDEFFYKVIDAQLSFHRDAEGKITGLTLHQNGRDLTAAREPGPVPHFEFPNAAALAEYAGDYDFGAFQPGATITVIASPSGLAAVLTGQQALLVFCTGKDRFDYDVVAASLTFERDAAGKIVAVVLHQNGRDMRAPRR